METLFFFFNISVMNSLASSPLFFIEAVRIPQWLYTNAELAPLLPALFIVGGFIIFTLSYVSWRKYKGEKKKDEKERDKLVD